MPFSIQYLMYKIMSTVLMIELSTCWTKRERMLTKETWILTLVMMADLHSGQCVRSKLHSEHEHRWPHGSMITQLWNRKFFLEKIDMYLGSYSSIWSFCPFDICYIDHCPISFLVSYSATLKPWVILFHQIATGSFCFEHVKSKIWRLKIA